MEDDSGWAEGNFDILLRSFVPVKNLFDVAFFHGEVIAVTDSRLKEDSDGVREFLDTGITEGGKLVEVVLLSGVVDGALDVLVEGVSLGGRREGSGS